jgi:hypothetical protein
MASFEQPDFIERQEAAAKARKVALENFRAKAADPALAERVGGTVDNASSTRCRAQCDQDYPRDRKSGGGSP